MQETITPFARAVAVAPTSATAYASLGIELERAGDPRAAIAALRKAAILSPKRADVYDGLGLVLSRGAASLDQHLHAEAPMMAPKPMRVEGGHDPCWQNKPPTCFPLQHYGPAHLELAEEDFMRRIQSDSNDLRGFQLLSRLYRNRSAEACVAALQLQPTRGTAYLTLARTLPPGASLSLYARALPLLTPAMELEREHGDVLRRLRYFGQVRARVLTPAAAAAAASNRSGRLAHRSLPCRRQTLRTGAPWSSHPPPLPPTMLSPSCALSGIGRRRHSLSLRPRSGCTPTPHFPRQPCVLSLTLPAAAAAGRSRGA